MKPLLRVQEVAALLSLRVSTIYDLCYRGVIPHVRLAQGRRRALVRFREEDIEEFLRERARPAEPLPR
jgi:excisionase family DNA binding protein